MLRDLPIEEVAGRLGLQVTHHKALCPFHNDRHPSLSFSTRRNRFRCFVCDAKGGTIDLVMKVMGKDFKEACRWLSNGELVSSFKFQVSSHLEPGTWNLEPFDASRYERFFERPWLSPKAKQFLFDERKLDPRVVRWCRISSWKDKQGTPWLQIPYFNMEGKLVGIQNRNLGVQSSRFQVSSNRTDLKPETGVSPMKPETSGAQPPRFRFPRGSQCGIYNLPVLNLLKPGEDLYIAEGCSDCWSLLSAGHKAIAIPSATLLSKKDVELFETWNLKLETQFHMFPDRDAPGERLFLQLQSVLPNLQHHQLPPGCKDYSEYYLSIQP